MRHDYTFAARGRRALDLRQLPDAAARRRIAPVRRRRRARSTTPGFFNTYAGRRRAATTCTSCCISATTSTRPPQIPRGTQTPSTGHRAAVRARATSAVTLRRLHDALRAVPPRPRPARRCTPSTPCSRPSTTTSSPTTPGPAGRRSTDEAKDGPWADRMDGALRAWEYWTPSAVRSQPRRAVRADVLRSADLVRFVLLETRTAPRRPRRASRTAQRARGQDQRRWVEEALRESPCTWTFVACPSMLSSIHRRGDAGRRRSTRCASLKLRAPGRGQAVPRPLGQLPGRAGPVASPTMGDSPSEVVVLSGDVHIAVDADPASR